MTCETAAGRYENPFLLSSLPAFLRGSVAMVVKDILFGCGYAALGSSVHIRLPLDSRDVPVLSSPFTMTCRNSFLESELTLGSIKNVPKPTYQGTECESWVV